MQPSVAKPAPFLGEGSKPKPHWLVRRLELGRVPWAGPRPLQARYRVPLALIRGQEGASTELGLTHHDYHRCGASLRGEAATGVEAQGSPGDPASTLPSGAVSMRQASTLFTDLGA